MSTGLDLDALEARARALLDAEDLEGIAALDEELRAYFGVDKGQNSGRSKNVPLDAGTLARLEKIYQSLAHYVGSVRNGLAAEVRGIKANKKGINAYRASD